MNKGDLSFDVALGASNLGDERKFGRVQGREPPRSGSFSRGERSERRQGAAFNDAA
jgi:hypothetical protein